MYTHILYMSSYIVLFRYNVYSYFYLKNVGKNSMHYTWPKTATGEAWDIYFYLYTNLYYSPHF